MNDSTNVSFGKPKAGGALFFAPLGTTLPANATDALDAAFENLGYISEDGLVNGIETDTESVKEWGGAEVLADQTSFAEMLTFNMLEVNANSMKLYYGEDNVDLDVDGNVSHIAVNSAVLPEVAFIAEIVLTGGRIKRIVVERGKIADRSGEISHVNNEAIMYPVQLKCMPDADGNTHDEYFAFVSSS